MNHCIFQEGTEFAEEKYGQIFEIYSFDFFAMETKLNQFFLTCN